MSSGKSFVVYNSAVSRLLQQKSFFFKESSLDEVLVFFSYNKFSSFNDYKILEVFQFLERFCGQKPVISKFSDGYVGSKRQYSVSIKVTISKKRLPQFIGYLRYCCIPNEVRRFGSFCLNHGKDNFEFSFKDWTVFHGLHVQSSVGGVRIRFKGSRLFLGEWLQLNGLFYRFLN